MIKADLKIINQLGLHARAAAKFVTLASLYHSKIEVKRGDKVVNGKSIMGVMMLAASCGTTIEVIVDGEDEKAALAAIKELIDNKFDEEK